MDDLIDCCIRLMNQPGITAPVNIANPGEFTMLELTELVLGKIGNPSKITHHPLPGDDLKQRQPDITLPKSALDWERQIARPDGLDSAIVYFRRIIG
ncbi:hypothetical protein HQ447_18285 [bacterium]|nr:hypothetical protein [bacterium]